MDFNKNIVFKAAIINARDLNDFASQLEEYVNRKIQENEFEYLSYNVLREKSIKNGTTALTKYEVLVSFKKASR